MDILQRCRIFIRVAEAASFTRAAETLALPRSSVSAAVQELEARLGTRLLHRTTRQVSLTPDGSVFLERSRHLLAEAEEMESLFRHTAAQPSGKLRIDVPSRIGRLLIAPALPAFLNTYPEIEIELGSSDRPVNLVADSVDCVIRVGRLADSGLIARKIADLPVISVASPDYLRRCGAPADITDLSRHQAVLYASPSTGRIEEWEWDDGITVRTVPMAGRVVVNSAETYIACCLAGLGLIQIPEYDVREHLARGALVEVMPLRRPAPMPAHFLYADRRHASLRLRVFMAWASTLFDPRLRAPPEAER